MSTGTGPVTILVEFQTHPGRGQDVAAFLEQKAYPSAKGADGFRSITLLRDREDADHLIEIEEWDSVEQYQSWVEPTLGELGPDLMPMLSKEPRAVTLEGLASA